MCAQARALLEAYLEEAEHSKDLWIGQAGAFETGRAILNEIETLQVAVAREGWERHSRRSHTPFVGRNLRQDQALLALLSGLFRYPLPLREDNLASLLEHIAHGDCVTERYEPLCALTEPVLCQALQYAEDYGLPAGWVPHLTSLREALAKVERKTLTARLDEKLGRTQPPPLVSGKPWGAEALQALAKMETEERAAWERLLLHARATELALPSPRWLERAKERIAEVGPERFERHVREWFALVEARSNAPLMDRNSATLQGLIWMCGLLDNPAIAGPLADMALIGYKKLPRSPILSGVMGDAAIYALSLLPGAEAAAQLGRLRGRLKHESAQVAIGKALQAAARRAAVPLEEIEELLVPTFEMEEPGLLRKTWGDFELTISFSGRGAGGWNWQRKDGKPQKSVPAQVKQAHAEELKALKETAADIQKLLSAQRDRIEKLLFVPREWDFQAWRARYLDHPLLAVLTQRLLWEFQTGGRWETGLWRDGRIEDVAGRPLAGLTDATRVRLWHPIHQEPESVLRWRNRLEALEISQPFKQAHREVYLLTEAERRTATYSNRFAAHILKHYPFHALCQGRGWRYTLPRYGYNENTPTLELPHWGLRVEFWVSALMEGEMSDTGVALALTTDQVRFFGRGDAPLPLTEIPAPAFSEVMRDVDLFVGVCSVGNDPRWRDGARLDTQRDYWEGYAFGALSASAQTRRDALERLLPRLRIASQCAVSERFLTVRGSLRTYKIHLGSGNILMEPNDQYLCIVPDQSAPWEERTENVFLPFEGDRTLSLILSKAFLLAEDTRITDPTILAQIQPT